MVEGLTCIEDSSSMNCNVHAVLRSSAPKVLRRLRRQPSRGGAVVARRAHNPKAGGSNPSPATNKNFWPARLSPSGHRGALRCPVRSRAGSIAAVWPPPARTPPGRLRRQVNGAPVNSRPERPRGRAPLSALRVVPKLPQLLGAAARRCQLPRPRLGGRSVR